MNGPLDEADVTTAVPRSDSPRTGYASVAPSVNPALGPADLDLRPVENAEALGGSGLAEPGSAKPLEAEPSIPDALLGRVTSAVEALSQGSPHECGRGGPSTEVRQLDGDRVPVVGSISDRSPGLDRLRVLDENGSPVRVLDADAGRSPDGRLDLNRRPGSVEAVELSVTGNLEQPTRFGRTGADVAAGHSLQAGLLGRWGKSAGEVQGVPQASIGSEIRPAKGHRLVPFGWVFVGALDREQCRYQPAAFQHRRLVYRHFSCYASGFLRLSDG